MKKVFLFLVAMVALFPLLSNAQIQVGSSHTKRGPGKISKDQLSKLSSTTTYFVLQEKDYDNAEAYEQAIAKVWDVTPFKIIRPEEINKLNKKTSSFFAMGYEIVVSSSRHISLTIKYDLYMLEPRKNKDPKKHVFGKFLLHPDGETVRFFLGTGRKPGKNSSRNLITHLYKKATLNNWNPTMLTGYLKVINDGLKEHQLRSIFKEYIDKEGLKELQHNTLYVPEYVNNKFNIFTGTEKDQEEDENDLKSAYDFPIKYV